MENEYRLNIKSDIYCTEDLLGFDQYIEALGKMVTHKDFKTPFCIGIFGKWGSGKTSFMRLLEKRLSASDSKPFIVPVWFNPWRYQKEEHLIIPFLKTIEIAIKRRLVEIGEKTGENSPLLSGLRKIWEKLTDCSAAIAYGTTFEAKLGGFGIAFDTARPRRGKSPLANAG